MTRVRQSLNGSVQTSEGRRAALYQPDPAQWGPELELADWISQQEAAHGAGSVENASRRYRIAGLGPQQSLVFSVGGTPYFFQRLIQLIDSHGGYDQHQLELLGRLAESVKRSVCQHVTDPALARKISGDVLFDLCTHLDGSVPANPRPLLCFQPDADTLLLGPSWLHEYVAGAIREVFAGEK